MPSHAGAYRGVSGISEQAAPARVAAMPSSGWRRWPRPGQKWTRAEARFYAHARIECVAGVHVYALAGMSGSSLEVLAHAEEECREDPQAAS